MKKSATKPRPKRGGRVVPPLQPLRIPPGWEVIINNFHELDPVFKTGDDMSWHFTQDMLWITQRNGEVGIDLDWLPDGTSTGHFVLRAIRIFEEEYPPYDPWRRPLKRLESRSRRKVVKAIEEWLAWYSEHDINESSKGV